MNAAMDTAFPVSVYASVALSPCLQCQILTPVFFIAGGRTCRGIVVGRLRLEVNAAFHISSAILMHFYWSGPAACAGEGL